MRQVKRWRYYCDYCGKSGGHKGYMRIHEAHCTMNPYRECGFCRAAGLQQAPLSTLIAALEKPVSVPQSLFLTDAIILEGQKRLANLRSAANDCPACMLATLRQSVTEGVCFIDFSFDEEKQRFWDAINRREK
jgi:hypothetical protein